jgi:hypothetical protein
MVTQKKTIGSDGKLTVGTFGAEIITPVALTVGKWYLITGIASSASAFPAGAVVGFMWKVPAAGATLASGDKAKLWTGADLCDITNWSMDWASNEVNVTSFCNDYNVYRTGKTDITGNVEGIFTVGLTDEEGGFQSQFVNIVHQNDSETSPADYKVTLAQGAILIGQLYVDKTTIVGEGEAFYLVPMSLTGFSASAGGEDAQVFSSPFRVAPLEGTELAFYRYVNQA